jgi:four helix bundle protein
MSRALFPRMEKPPADRPPTFEDRQDIRDRAFAFGCQVVTFCQKLYYMGGVGRLMVPQLVSCSLSFATMLEEARAAESDADFISKCSISLKESREAWTRLRVSAACRIGSDTYTGPLVVEANELIAIVTTIIRNKRRNAGVRSKARRKRPSRSYEFQIPNS